MQRTAPHGAPSSFLLYPRQAASCARTPAISIVASSPIATPSKPWANRAPAAAPSPANIRQGLPAWRQACCIRVRAALKRCSSKAPGSPIEIDRSKGPIKMPSTPSIAAIFSISASASVVSHWGITSVSPLKCAIVSSTPAGVSVPQPSFRDGQNPLCPTGAYLA